MTNPTASSAETGGMQAPQPWQSGKCGVPMWSGFGGPAGFCDAPALGHQLPAAYLYETRSVTHPAYCRGHCCPMHGGPRDGEPIIFQDGHTEEGRPMWCAVMPGFVNLQENHAGFDGNPMKAVANLRAAIAKATGAA